MHGYCEEWHRHSICHPCLESIESCHHMRTVSRKHGMNDCDSKNVRLSVFLSFLLQSAYGRNLPADQMNWTILFFIFIFFPLSSFFSSHVNESHAYLSSVGASFLVSLWTCHMLVLSLSVICRHLSLLSNLSVRLSVFQITI
ncbi:hypothetical protein GGR55DRAFT_428379 [Xylaria sp. FL0064]|nr:hypothetical protein GGR55DRAFT_428379 [Xylaria sp. FL0064]